MRKRLSVWFGKKPQVYVWSYLGRPSVVIFNYYSKNIYSLIREYLDWEGKKGYTIKLKNLNLKNKEFNIGFLRGLIDTDGNFYAPKRRISLASVSKELMKQVNLILIHNCNLLPKYYCYKKVNCADLHTLTLHGKNAKRFIELVKSGNPNKRGSGLAW